MKIQTLIRNAAAGLAISAASFVANAIPTLQLGIAGGTYDNHTQTIVSTGPVFSLYAYLISNNSNRLDDVYFLSMAISPAVHTPSDLGSFTINNQTVNVTSGMIHGTPPLDILYPNHDAGDLPYHGIYPTYYRQHAFQFSGSQRTGAFNTQDHPSWSTLPGTGMYYQRFDIDISNLAAGYAVHFDLYNSQLCLNGRGQCNGLGDIDITQFAPFSHDAQSATSVTTVPEPATLLLLGLGLLGTGLARRRIK